MFLSPTNAVSTLRLPLARAIGALMLGLLAGSVMAADQVRPNVIVVLTDDQAYADLGVHGNPHVRTPNLDRFAREGTQFSRFYVSPVCSPTRASILTGRYHYRTGVLHTSRGGAKMHGDEVTLAEQLRAAGYRTGIFGKWHLGDNYPMRPTDQGFAQALIHKSGGIAQGPDAPSSYFDPRLWANNEPKQTTGYCTDLFFSAAIDFIAENRRRPFFVYLPTNAPHTPLDVSPRYRDPYLAMGLPDETARVYGMVENIDENFGRLLTALEKLGLRENTVVLFLSDNGGTGKPRYDAGLRGGKSSVYEGGIRVPCFLQWPAGLRGGRTIDRIAAHVDLMPTVLDLTGVSLPPGGELDGISLRPLLTGGVTAPEWPERRLFIQCHRGLEPRRYQNFAAISQRYKLIGHPGTFGREELDTTSQPPVLELYDLTADRGEKHDLSSRQTGPAADLLREYEQWFDRVAAARHFAPGLIAVGSDAETRVHLSRYQDGGYPGGIRTGWMVRVLAGGKYAVRFVRGDHPGPVTLVLSWLGGTSGRPLAAGEDTATFELRAGEGVLDIWLDSDRGERIPYTGNNTAGDAVLRRL
jgi:arylsulfatase A-like enzyme